MGNVTRLPPPPDRERKIACEHLLRLALNALADQIVIAADARDPDRMQAACIELDRVRRLLRAS